MAKPKRDTRHAPHDKLFKAIYSHPENAAAHFETFLPSTIVNALDLTAAELVPGTFVDDSLPGRRTDLLYRIPRRNAPGEGDRDVLLYVVFEHQSTVDRMMAFRMYRYVARIWERWLAEHPDALERSDLLRDCRPDTCPDSNQLRRFAVQGALNTVWLVPRGDCAIFQDLNAGDCVQPSSATTEK